jgi:hypothetical protein
LLEAKQISHVYGDYSYKPRPVAKPKPEAKKANNLAVKVAIVSCVLLAVITGLLLTATHTQITYKTDNILLACFITSAIFDRLLFIFILFRQNIS